MLFLLENYICSTALKWTST
jgi:hypothetical protein